MLSINEVSRLREVPVGTLCYFDEIGLLRSIKVKHSDHQHYSTEELSKLDRILILRDLGLSVHQIEWLLDKSISTDEMQGMLLMRQLELEQRKDAEQALLKRVEARLRQLDGVEAMSVYEVMLREIAPQTVIAVRDVIPVQSDFVQLLAEVFAHLRQQGVNPSGPPVLIYYDDEYRERDIDVEVAVPVDVPACGTRSLTARELPYVESMACVVHRESYDTISLAYAALAMWIEDKGYRVAGPHREIYVHGLELDGEAIPRTIEIQFPVMKAQ